MKNEKKEITDRQRRVDLITGITLSTVSCLYAGLRMGYCYNIMEEPNMLMAMLDLVNNIMDKPWMIFPTNLIAIGLWQLANFIIIVLMYNKYLIYKGTVENAHGDAHFETDYNQYEKEYVADPKIIEQVTGRKIPDRQCPRNDEGKKVYKKIQPSSKKWHKVMEECRRNAMVYTDKIYLSLNGGWCQRNTNSIVFGASGTGKSRYFLKPNILQNNGSFICTDPSGDIMLETGYFLEKICGYEIKCFNISDMSKSCRFNPLYYIRDTKDIPIVAQTFLDNMKGEGAKSGGDGDFWDKSAKALLCCCIGYLYEVCPMEQRNLSNVLELIRLDKHEEDEAGGTLSEFDELFEALGQANPASYAFQQYNTYTQAPVKTRNNILISTSVNLQQLDIPEVKNLTYKDEMDLDFIGSKKMAIFLNIPQADSTYCWLTAMLYSLLFKRLYMYGEERMKTSAFGFDYDAFYEFLDKQRELNPEHKNEYIDTPELRKAYENSDFRVEKKKALGNPEMRVPVRFLIDECANVGKIPNLEKYLATCRKYRLSIVPIFQNYSQIVETYGKEKANNIVSNCDAFLFLGGSDKDTVEIIQGHLGKETVRTLSHSMARSSKGSNSDSKQQTGKDLMTKDQIETMSNANCLLFIRALRPFNTKKYNLNRHPNYKYLSEGNEGKAYPNPFDLEYEDENIEGIRIKTKSEEGYVAPAIVDSARRRNLIATNKKKVIELKEVLKDLNNQLNNASTDAQKDSLKAQIDKIAKDITKLEMTDPDKNGENEARRINGMEVIKTNPFKESDETKQPEDIKPKKDIIEENPDLSNILNILSVESFAPTYEFDTATDFKVDKLIIEEPKSDGSDMSKDISEETITMDSMLNSFNTVIPTEKNESSSEVSTKAIEDTSVENSSKEEKTEEKSFIDAIVEESSKPEQIEEPEFTEDNSSSFIDEIASYDPSMEDTISPSDFGGFDF